MFDYKNYHPFFIKKNYTVLFLYIINYLLQYSLAIISSFLSLYTNNYNNLDYITFIYFINKKNELPLYYLHSITSLILIFHMYNEINRELFYLYNKNNYKEYNIFRYLISSYLLIISYISNTILSYMILKNNIYISMLFNSYIIIHILQRTYIVLNDKNHSSSIIFYNNIHYIRNNIVNNLKKVECFIDYPKDVYV